MKKAHQQDEKEEEKRHWERSQEGDESKMNVVFLREKSTKAFSTKYSKEPPINPKKEQKINQ